MPAYFIDSIRPAVSLNHLSVIFPIGIGRLVEARPDDASISCHRRDLGTQRSPLTSQSMSLLEVGT
jgi:hypothetical protein